ncbi:hypothetical protein [Aquihabitans sp. McL0605]|uniref:hypothetical protein n=1 Tax=Aquihabitans sp. McL0605 TaxID=3415671 RepID=UPI003CEA9D8C
MAYAHSRELPFDEDDLTPITAVMDQMAAAASGWINFVPEVEEGHEPEPRNPVVAIFSARGDAVPMATWYAPEKLGGRATLGVEHGSGPKALAKLARFESPLEAGWLKVADHPRRGLVVTSPRDVDTDHALWWLLTATHILSVVPLTGTWLARVYEP